MVFSVKIKIAVGGLILKWEGGDVGHHGNIE
jgi:hypothetical protein